VEQPAVFGELQKRCPAAAINCVVPIMQANGASPEAIAFFQKVHWFLVGLVKEGSAYVGSLYNPWAANSNDQFVILDGTPPLVYPDRLSTSVSITSDPAYPALLSAYPSLAVWGSGPYLEKPVPASGGATRLVFDYHLANGCHACPTAYAARIALDFSAAGALEGPARSLGLCQDPLLGVGVAAVSAPVCPAPIAVSPEAAVNILSAALAAGDRAAAANVATASVIDAVFALPTGTGASSLACTRTGLGVDRCSVRYSPPGSTSVAFTITVSKVATGYQATAAAKGA